MRVIMQLPLDVAWRWPRSMKICKTLVTSCSSWATRGRLKGQPTQPPSACYWLPERWCGVVLHVTPGHPQLQNIAVIEKQRGRALR